ncbi:hypothetical protein F4821DRAFT_251326, partial [Hypoxylon rubiginosum]
MSVVVIRNLYSQLPNVDIEELRIHETDLNTRRMMDLMAVKEGGSMSLYFHVVNRILRDLRLERRVMPLPSRINGSPEPIRPSFQTKSARL